MKLEDEIKQKKFKNEFHKLAVNLIFTHGWLLDHQAKFFKKFGITGAQYNILRILRGQHPNPASINLLKERMLDKMSDASRLVERLKQKGLVEREVCTEDRRRVEVVINDKGLNLLKEMDKIEDRFEQIFKGVGSGEAKSLNDLLDRLRG
ncbi:MAG: MarR family transcriptional regulator [Melioribacteraceae bacterium]|jgi:DNA-binding MarR family transcriptional regulator|nr:MarR family transcriptional regulator [Melioribacteraceae bacterium]